MIIIAEGARNVGKTYLLNSMKDKIDVYKYPFSDWFNTIFKDMSKNSEDPMFYMPFGMETAVLDLKSKGIINKPILVDRSFLSNAVFGIMTKRITREQAIQNILWLLSKWPDSYHIIYIDADIKSDDRNKDQWEIYDPIKTRMIYEDLMSRLNFNITTFKNNFDTESVKEFNDIVDNLIIRHCHTQ
jgi:hypothetical protein